MTKSCDEFKDEICRLHKVMKLKDVRKVMKDKGFDASESWYRKRLSQWGERKIDNPPSDSSGPSVTQPPSIRWDLLGYSSDPTTKTLPQHPQKRRAFTPAPVYRQSYDSGYGTDPSRASSSTTASFSLPEKSRAHRAHASTTNGTAANSSSTSIIEEFPTPLPALNNSDFGSSIPSRYLAVDEVIVPDDIRGYGCDGYSQGILLEAHDSSGAQCAKRSRNELLCWKQGLQEDEVQESFPVPDCREGPQPPFWSTATHIPDFQMSDYNCSTWMDSSNCDQAVALSNFPKSDFVEANRKTDSNAPLRPDIAQAASANMHGFAPFHPPISRCKLATDGFYIRVPESGRCQGCYASIAHYVASVARLLDQEALFDLFSRFKPCMDETDIFGNTPLHFLSSAAPNTLRHLELFGSRNVIRTNLDNETFLHVLDPAHLGNDLITLLRDVCAREPAQLQARTYQGKTVLHCLLSRVTDINCLKSILAIFQKAKNNINARDSQGKTAVEIFCQQWLSAQDYRQRSRSGPIEIQRLIAIHAPNLELLFHSGRATVMDVNNTLSGQSPSGRFSGDHSSAAQEKRANEMQTLMAESLCNPLKYDYRGRNGLHCLAHVIGTLPSLNVSLETQRNDLIQLLENMLTSGVDANDYDFRGQIPLHAIITTSYDGQDEDFRASLIERMIARGDGVRSVHMRDYNGETPLHLACRSGLVACTKALLSHKSNVHALNYAGRTVIYEAMQARENKMRIYPELSKRIQNCISLVEMYGGQENSEPFEKQLHDFNARKLTTIQGSPGPDTSSLVPSSIKAQSSLTARHRNYSHPLSTHPT